VDLLYLLLGLGFFVLTLLAAAGIARL